MTEKEYNQIRNTYSNYSRSSNRVNRNQQNEPDDGYFAFFKLRCLICTILLLGLIGMDRQVHIRDHEKVQQVVQLLEKEEVTIEECFQIIN